MKALNGVVAAAALLVAACAPGGTMQGPAGPRDAAERVTVTVRNNNWSDMVVYMVQGGSRVRLGLVTSLRTETFAIPRTTSSAGGAVRLLADPVGSMDTFLSDAVWVRPGQRVSMEVGTRLSISFVSLLN